jgi:hypothetical protein
MARLVSPGLHFDSSWSAEGNRRNVFLDRPEGREGAKSSVEIFQTKGLDLTSLGAAELKN